MSPPRSQSCGGFFKTYLNPTKMETRENMETREIRTDIQYNYTIAGHYYAGFDAQVNDSWIVVLDESGETVEILQLPLITVRGYGNHVINIYEVVRSLRQYESISMLSEKIQPFNQGSKGSFTFGSALNLIGQLQNEPHIDMSLLLPQQWKGKYGLTSDKELSVLLARRKGLKWEGKLSHNLAESYLLACFICEASLAKQA